MSKARYLAQFLDPLTDILSPEVAQRIVNLRAPQPTQARAAELAKKWNPGTLSAEEEAEYKDLVDAVDIIGLLQANARKYLIERSA
jgi:hypothetical protein